MAQRVEVVLDDEEREVLERWGSAPEERASVGVALPDRVGGPAGHPLTLEILRAGNQNLGPET